MYLSDNQYIGAFFEIYGAMLLGAKRENVDNFNSPFDWTLEGYKVDAKAAKVKIDKRDHCPLVVFNLHYTYIACDFFWLVAYTGEPENPIPLKSWLIPSCLLERQNVTIRLKNDGAYSKYEVPIDYNLLYSRRFHRALKEIKSKRKEVV